MANINDILARAAALRDETALNSISPERAGGIMYDTLLALNDLWLQQGSALVISKIYASVAAMEADTAPISDLTGQPLRPGQIVVIASSDSDNGTIYRYNGTESPSWSAVGQMGNSEPVDSLDSDSSVRPLAAHQGKVLDRKVNENTGKIDPIFDALVGKTTESVTFKSGVTGNIKITGDGFYGGKNLIEYADVAETTTNNVTWKIVDGVIYLSGTASANSYLKFPCHQVTFAKSKSMNLKCLVTGTVSGGNIGFWLGDDTSKLVYTGDIYESSFASGVSDTQKTTSATYDTAQHLYVYIPNGVICTDVTIRPMITYSARYGAGDYEIGGSAIPFSGEVDIPNANGICVQGGSAIVITYFDISSLDALSSVPDNVSALLGEHKLVPFSGNNVCAIRDGLVGSNMISCLLNNLQSGTVKVIGKNLLNIEGLQTTGGSVVFTPIALLPFTTYTYSDDYGQWYGKNARISIYSGTSDSDRAEKYVFVDSGQPNRSSFSFTTDAGPLFWLRYYPNSIVNIKAQTTNCMLAEGDKVAEFEHYTEQEVQLSENLPSVIDNPCYLFSSGSAISGTFYLQLMGEEGVLPSYWETYMAGKIIELKSLMASTSMHSLIFQFFTDVHLPSNAGYSPALMKEIKEKAGIGNIVFGGDILNYAWNDADLAKLIFYDFREKYLVGDGHTFCVRGNHDAYHNAGDSLFYNTLVRPLNDRFDTNGANSIHRVFYHIDDESQKVRLINFDSGDWSDREFKVQFDWLVDTLNSVPSGWGCVLFTHIVVNGETPANDIRAIVKAFIERRAGTQTLYNGETVSFDFTSATGEMVCIIGGHNHKDWSDTAIGCPCIAVTCDAIGEKIDAGPSMTPGTSTEQAFDVFFIDLDAKTITAKRIGAGEDRTWTYGE